METPATQRREISAGYFTMKNLEQELFREAQNLAALHGIELDSVTLTIRQDFPATYLLSPKIGGFGIGGGLPLAIDALKRKIKVQPATPHSD